MIEIQVNNQNLTRVSEFISFWELVSLDNPSLTMSVDEFLALVINVSRIEEGVPTFEDVTNLDKIIDSIPSVSQTESVINEIKSSPDPEIFINTVFHVPVEALKRDFIGSTSNFVYKQNNQFAFFGEKIRDILNEDSYTTKSGLTKQNVRSKTVYVWCRSLDYPNGALVNISLFIEQLAMNVSENGGNFSITLPAIRGTFDIDGNLQVDSSDIKFYIENNLQNWYSKSSTSNGNNERQDYLFHLMINSNDVVFISNESLFKEPNASPDLIIPFNEAGYYYNNNGQKVSRKWDMIGLVDRNNVLYTPQNSVTSINVIGRDLFKLVIEDNEVFLPLTFAGVDIYGAYNNTNGNLTGDSRTLRRIDGKLNVLNQYLDQTIESALTFIFSYLTHISIIPNSFFDEWNDDDLTFFRYVQGFRDIEVPVNNPLPGEPSTDTIRQVSGFTDEKGNGIWQLVRLLVDDDGSESSLKIRRIVDSSIAEEQGSIINYIRRIVQPPFAEIWGDTYGNNYFFIVRKPPYTEKAYRNLIDISDRIDGEGKGDFHIREKDVISENLGFNDGQAYSWYRLTPNGNIGMGDFAIAYIPAVFFPEYAEMFGNKALQVVSNYVDYKGFQNSSLNQSVDTLQKQAIQDLRFMIETNSYLPFTRRGTITITPDRRIKRGMAIRYLPTNEVFHVDQVSRTSVIGKTVSDRMVLTVSRGMVDKNISGVETFKQYFNIINFDDKAQDLSNELSREENVQNPNSVQLNLPWRVNPKIFEFFIKRRQFSKSNLNSSLNGLIIGNQDIIA